MKNLFPSVLQVLLLAAFFGVGVKAQEKANESVPNGLVLEVTYFKGRPPAFQTISPKESKCGAWYALFRRIGNRPSNAGSLPVRAVNIVSHLEGDAAKVRISVFTGIKYHDKEEFVADYTIRENEKAVIKELTEFGVEPFQIGAVRNLPTISDLPTPVNKTDSLQIVNVEPNYSTLPTYKLKLLNSSGKAVIAFTLEERADGEVKLSAMPQGNQGEFLIAPGGTIEKIIPSSFERKTYNKEPIAAQPNREIVVSSVVFEDGSYEGDFLKAANFLAFALGRKSQLQKILHLLESALNSRSDLNELYEQISNLSLETDDNAYNELMGKLPNLTENQKSNIRNAAQIASHRVRKITLEGLASFMESQKGVKKNKNNEWLIKTKREYGDWLAKLP